METLVSILINLAIFWLGGTALTFILMLLGPSVRERGPVDWTATIIRCLKMWPILLFRWFQWHS